LEPNELVARLANCVGHHNCQPPDLAAIGPTF